MGEIDAGDARSVLQRVRKQAEAGEYRITVHANQEMWDEDISLAEVLEAIVTAHVLENYPQHRRGPCCLLNGQTRRGRPLHVVCTTACEMLILITVYEPKPPRWISPTQRRQQ
jgi:hypothetical protein